MRISPGENNILAAIGDEAVARADIMGRVGRGKTSTDAHLRALVHKRLIERIAKGVYRKAGGTAVCETTKYSHAAFHCDIVQLCLVDGCHAEAAPKSRFCERHIPKPPADAKTMARMMAGRA